jgi:ABC-2 type transport system permease protein
MNSTMMTTGPAGTTTASAVPIPLLAPTSLVRLELVRWVRTHRLLGLSALFLMLGLCLPIVTANLAWLFERSPETRALADSLPEPTPADGIAAYLAQVGQLGMVVLIAAVAGPLCPYGSRAAGLYYWALTRDSRFGRLPASATLLFPRFMVATAATVLVYLLGLVGAGYETTVLIGAPALGDLLAGAALSCLYLVWVSAVVALIGSRATGQIVTATLSVLVVLVCGVAQQAPWIGTAMPGRLLSAPADLLTGGRVTDYLPAAGVALASTVALLAIAVVILDRREL